MLLKFALKKNIYLVIIKKKCRLNQNQDQDREVRQRQEIRDPKTKRCRAKELQTKRCRAKELPGRPKIMRKSKSKINVKVEFSKNGLRKYLMNLSDSGVVNMMCAAPYLQRKFGLSREDAEEVLDLWMNGLSEKKEKSKSISPGLIQRRIESEKKWKRIEYEKEIHYHMNRIQEAMAKEYQKR